MERIVFIGAVATAVMDLWGFARKPLMGVATPNYGLVGRWIGHMAGGRFRHDAIASSSPIAHERLIGWVVHYLTGVAFAAVLVGFLGVSWIQSPTVGPAVLVGLATSAAPFLLMQPGMGAGIAASKTPRPASARIQTLVTHTVFGLGLYIAGLVAHLIS